MERLVIVSVLINLLYMTKSRAAFTLIELLVSIAIIALIITLVIPNYLGARERARDTKLKSEMEQLKNSLRTYYNDFQRYPASTDTNKIKGCGESGTGDCPCNETVDFAIGTSCETVYMKKFPADRTFGSEDTDTKYYVSDDGDRFCILTTLENYSDPDLAKSQARCTYSCNIVGENYVGGIEIPSTSYVVCSQ